MAIDLQPIEAFLLAKLEPLRSPHNVRVEPMSDLVFQKAVTVSMLYLNFVAIAPSEILNFNRLTKQMIKYEVILRLQDLRSHTRAYPIIKAISEALSGQKPVANCREIEMREQKFLADLVADGLWVYQLGFDFEIYGG
ncbi:MAG: hypothetical protein SFT94_02215 [Pseudanabaenaceae cyanobacterium bins.68]|nr:hypothetical protein [Pseudanabaenaceae cyanobacterium bins.68]